MDGGGGVPPVGCVAGLCWCAEDTTGSSACSGSGRSQYAELKPLATPIVSYVCKCLKMPVWHGDGITPHQSSPTRDDVVHRLALSRTAVACTKPTLLPL